MIDTTGFLMIEPTDKATEPVVDDLTKRVMLAWSRSTTGNSYRGWHKCVCGALSDNCDHFIQVQGKRLRTNSLCVHYIACHRGEVPFRDMELIKALPDADTYLGTPSQIDLLGRGRRMK